ncbi:hypothetical protein Tco_0837848 [Tanacetum coccineum]
MRKALQRNNEHVHESTVVAADMRCEDDDPRDEEDAAEDDDEKVTIERAFLSSGGRGVKQKENSNTVSNDATVGKNVAGSSSMSNNDTVSGNNVDTSSIAAKIHDMERQMLEGKLVLVGDDGIPVKSLNVDGQASSMDPFTCLSNTFGTP